MAGAGGVSAAAPTVVRPRTASIFGSVLLALLAVHAAGAVLDFWAAIASPLELDYGEGIVWQQAALLPGPRAYSPATGLPFIVFHYPPLYHLLTRAVGVLTPDLLAAGRLVSAACTLGIAGLVGALVWRGTDRDGFAALGAALLVLCLHATRTWGLFMRVDMLAALLGLVGLWVGARAEGRFWGTLAALLICTAAVFTKQTQLAPGVAVLLWAGARHPRAALGAAGVAAGAGLAVVLALQAVTDGGFLLNILGYNVNRMSLAQAGVVLWAERQSWPAMGAMIAAACLLRDRRGLRGLMLLHFVLATIMLVTIGKSGSNFNYLIEWLCTGCVLLGIAASDTGRFRLPLPAGEGRGEGHGEPDRGRLWWLPSPRPSPEGRGGTVTWLVLASLWLAVLPMRQWAEEDQAALIEAAALVQEIATAPKPVASEDMVLLMRAGRGVTYEASIATELASVGRWDEAPLVDLIRRGGFAFMITSRGLGTLRQTPAVQAAIDAAYPRTEPLRSGLSLRRP